MPHCAAERSGRPTAIFSSSISAYRAVLNRSCSIPKITEKYIYNLANQLLVSITIPPHIGGTPMLSPELTRAARALLNWSQTELGAHSDLSLSAIRDFENGTRSLLKNNLSAIQNALESAGIVFVSDSNSEISIKRVAKGSNMAIVGDPRFPSGLRRV